MTDAGEVSLREDVAATSLSFLATAGDDGRALSFDVGTRRRRVFFSGLVAAGFRREIGRRFGVMVSCVDFRFSQPGQEHIQPRHVQA
jgi:hypothetical protein